MNVRFFSHAEGETMIQGFENGFYCGSFEIEISDYNDMVCFELNNAAEGQDKKSIFFKFDIDTAKSVVSVINQAIDYKSTNLK